MRVEEAMTFAPYLKEKVTFSINPDRPSPFTQKCFDNFYGSYFDVAVDKLQWAIKTKLGIPTEEFSYVTFQNGLKWHIAPDGLVNIDSNLSVSEGNWSWERFSGSSDVDTVERLINDMGISCPNLLALYCALRPLSDYGEAILSSFELDELAALFADYASSDLLDLYELCVHVDSDYLNASDLSENDEVFMEICKYLALILKYVLYAGIYYELPEDVVYDVSSDITDGYTVAEYVKEVYNVAHELWLPFLPDKAFYGIAPHLFCFMAYPSGMSYCTDCYGTALWILCNEDDVPSYITWRAKHKRNSSKLLRALDAAVDVIRLPFGTISDYNTNISMVVDNMHIAVCATGDYGSTYANPMYTAARHIFDTLYPVWSERYLKTTHS